MKKSQLYPECRLVPKDTVIEETVPRERHHTCGCGRKWYCRIYPNRCVVPFTCLECSRKRKILANEMYKWEIKGYKVVPSEVENSISVLDKMHEFRDVELPALAKSFYFKF